MNKSTLGDLFEIQQGFAFKSEKYLSYGKYALCTLGNIGGDNNFSLNQSKMKYYPDEFSHDFILKEGDLIVPLTEQTFGLFGNSAFIPKANGYEYVLNQRVGKVVIKDNVIDKYYLHYLLSTQLVRKQIEATAKGTSQRNTSPEKMYDVVVWIPEIGIQRQIGKSLYDVEKKINTNKIINEKLQQMAKTLYDYWFTQFDFPDKNGKPYKSSGGKMVYSEQLKREIPEDWEVSPILNILNWKSNSQPPKTEFIFKPKDGYIRFIQNRDYDSNSYLTYIPYKDSLTTCTKKDILIDKYGDAGRVRYGIDGVFNVALAKLDLNNPLYLEYVRFYFEDSSIYNYLHNSCMASTRASLNENNVRNLNITIPSNETINMFNQIVEPIRNKILLNMDEIKKLTSLKEFLLPMLMNGQATICDNVLSMPIKESEVLSENIIKDVNYYNQRFEIWLSSCGLAARGDVDKKTLREIFDAMDEDDK